MSSEDPHRDNLSWLEVKHHADAFATAEGPFASTDKDRSQLRGILEALYNRYGVSPEPLTAASATVTNDPYFDLINEITGWNGTKTVKLSDGKPVFTLTWKLEFKPDIAAAVKAAKKEPLNLYTVRVPNILPVETGNVKPTQTQLIQQSVLTGAKYFNLGDQDVTTFLNKDEAIKHAKQVLNDGPADYNVMDDLKPLRISKTRADDRVLYGTVMSGDYFLKGFVTVTKVVVTEDKREHPSV